MSKLNSFAHRHIGKLMIVGALILVALVCVFGNDGPSQGAHLIRI